jgi:hypothetical protein
MRLVLGRRHVHGYRLRVRPQPLDQPRRPRRRRCQLPRPVAEPQPELQHVPGLFGLRPLGQFVAPGGGELRPAEPFRIIGAKDHPLGPARPDQRVATQKRALTLRRHPHDAALPAHHHRDGLGHRLADQRDRRNPLSREPTHPLGPRTRLARTAPRPSAATSSSRLQVGVALGGRKPPSYREASRPFRPATMPRRQWASPSSRVRAKATRSTSSKFFKSLSKPHLRFSHSLGFGFALRWNVASIAISLCSVAAVFPMMSARFSSSWFSLERSPSSAATCPSISSIRRLTRPCIVTLRLLGDQPCSFRTGAAHNRSYRVRSGSLAAASPRNTFPDNRDLFRRELGCFRLYVRHFPDPFLRPCQNSTRPESRADKLHNFAPPNRKTPPRQRHSGVF